MIFIREICNEYAKRIVEAKENGRKLAIKHAPAIAETIREEFFRDSDDFKLVVYVNRVYMRVMRRDCSLTVLDFSLFTTDDEMLSDERKEFRCAYIEQLCEELPELMNASIQKLNHDDQFDVTFDRDFIINFNALQEVYNKNKAEGSAN